MTILLIGGTGFIGRRVVRLLTAAGERVVCMGPRVGEGTFAGIDGDVRGFRGDAIDFDKVMAAMVAATPERVLNLGYLHGNGNDPRTAFKHNVLAMDNVFEAARLAGVKRVVFASTLGVHGLQANFGEDAVTEEAAFYGIGSYCHQKIFNEWQAQDYAAKHGMSIIAIRPANVSGFDKRLGSVEHVRLITEPARGKAVTLPHGGFMRLVIDVDDVSGIFVRALLAAAPRHGVYTTGGHPTSLRDLADIVRRAIPGADIRFADETGGGPLSNVYLVDNSRLVDEFGLTLRPLEETVAKVIADVCRHG